MTVEELGHLLWGTAGVSRRSQGFEFRTAASAGALYPYNTYVVVNHVEGVAPGLYVYDESRHQCQLIRAGDYSRSVAAASLDQGMAARAAVVIAWTIVPERAQWKYGQRAYRYMYLDLGHVGQNFYLAATALGLGACTIAALYDGEWNELLGVDGVHETMAYLGVAGNPAGAARPDPSANSSQFE
jgi:SagB-type dehydrogenase family enzyme